MERKRNPAYLERRKMLIRHFLGQSLLQNAFEEILNPDKFNGGADGSIPPAVYFIIAVRRAAVGNDGIAKKPVVVMQGGKIIGSWLRPFLHQRRQHLLCRKAVVPQVSGCAYHGFNGDILRKSGFPVGGGFRHITAACPVLAQAQIVFLIVPDHVHMAVRLIHTGVYGLRQG